MKGRLIDLSVVKQERRIAVEAAWERFRVAMLRSKETLTIEDGIAAGKAYVEFLDAFAKAGL